MSELGWLGLVDDLRNATIFELPGFVCGLRRDILSVAKEQPISAKLMKVSEDGWLGRRDSNPRMSEPKSDALPLGDAMPYFSPLRFDLISEQLESLSYHFVKTTALSVCFISRNKRFPLTSPVFIAAA